jgi:hypothetical protein
MMQETFSSELYSCGSRNTLPRAFVKKDSGTNLTSNNTVNKINAASSQSKLQNDEINLIKSTRTPTKEK